MKKILLLFLVFYLGACSSLSDLQRMAMGDEVEVDDDRGGRSPASAKRNGRVLIHKKEFQGSLEQPAVGADLGKNEFGVQSRTFGGKDPWFGTGPANEGSLWNGQSQDNFYFTVNTSFKVGDIIYVAVDQDVNDSLNSKIAALLGEKGKSTRRIASEEIANEVGGAVGDRVGQAVGNGRIGDAVGRDVGQSVQSQLDIDEKYVNIDRIPVRIIEALDQNLFRVEGDRKIFIRNAPYRVAMSGRIRHEDLSAEGSIDSTKVLESKLELTK